MAYLSSKNHLGPSFKLEPPLQSIYASTVPFAALVDTLVRCDADDDDGDDGDSDYDDDDDLVLPMRRVQFRWIMCSAALDFPSASFQLAWLQSA